MHTFFLTTQGNFDIALCVYTNPHAIRCRVEARRERNGASIGTFYLVLGGGRTPLWAGPARASSISVLSQPNEDILSADYMQATRIAFNTREDAIQFAEKQGEAAYINRHVSNNGSEFTIRLGLLYAARDGEAHSSEELQVTFQ
jgi:hypothetical protein